MGLSEADFTMRRNVAHFVFCCLHRKGWIIASFAVAITIAIGLISINHNSSVLWQHGDTLEETVAVMQTRLKFLESKYNEKKEEIYYMQTRVEGGFNSTKKVTHVTNTTYAPGLVALLRNISGSKTSDAFSYTPELIETPFSLRIMPHLMENPETLRPAYQLQHESKYVEYIIGIPHVKRDKETYLYGTLRFLLNNLNEDDKNCTMLVVMIGDTDLQYVIETVYNIEQIFPDEMDLGLIDVISPSKYYYPNLTALAPTLGDSPKRTRWRTKQNLDAIYLMAFAQSRCLYYLMLEDDVIAADDYMEEIRSFTAETTASNPDWIFIQYSSTGGIGKLFRTADLINFITYVQLFYSNMPIDWLTESYLADRTCSINKTGKLCTDAKNKIRPTYKKDLFKHVGFFSSLKGKIQKVKGKPKESVAVFFPHGNPPVKKIKSDLKGLEDYTIEKTYRGESNFLGSRPKRGDVIEFWFKEPLAFGRYMIRSGNFDNAMNKISRAAIEVLPNKPNAQFTKVDEFDEFGLVEGHLTGNTYGELLAIRVRFEEDSYQGVAINEMEFVPLKEENEIRERNEKLQSMIKETDT